MPICFVTVTCLKCRDVKTSGLTRQVRDAHPREQDPGQTRWRRVEPILRQDERKQFAALRLLEDRGLPELDSAPERV